MHASDRATRPRGLAARGETDIMVQTCGAGMMIFGVLAAMLGLGLLGSLIALVWVGIGRLRPEIRTASSG